MPRNYRGYIESLEWQQARARFSAERFPAGPFCERCGRRFIPLDCHHLNYDRFGRELASDVLFVCPSPCHPILDRERVARERKLAAAKRAQRLRLRHASRFELTTPTSHGAVEIGVRTVVRISNDPLTTSCVFAASAATLSSRVARLFSICASASATAVSASSASPDAFRCAVVAGKTHVSQGSPVVI